MRNIRLCHAASDISSAAITYVTINPLRYNTPGTHFIPTAVHSDLSSSSCFCRHLKTELFSRAYGVN